MIISLELFQTGFILLHAHLQVVNYKKSWSCQIN